MRVKRGVTSRRKHKKILKATKGYRGAAGKAFKRAKEAWIHAGQHAYRSRRQKKRDYRSLWIVRINAVLDAMGYSYSKFIGALKKKNIMLDRKVLSEMALSHEAAFKSLVKEVMA